MMALIESPYAPQSQHRGLVTDMASQRVAGVGRIGDDAAFAHDRRRARNQAALRMGGLNLEILRHACFGVARPRGSPAVPDGLQTVRKRRQGPELDLALTRSVEIRTARREQAKFTGESRVL